MKKKLRSVFASIICLGCISAAEAGDPDAAAQSILQSAVVITLDGLVLAGGTYTLVHNLGYLSNRHEWEAEIITGYIAGGLNIAAGAIIISDGGEHIYVTSGKSARDFGIVQMVFGVLCTGSAVWAHIESKKPLPDPPPLTEEVKLTPEAWYTYWGLGLGNAIYSSDIQRKIDQFGRDENPRHMPLNLDLFGIYLPVTSKTITGVIVNAQSDTYRSEMGKIAVRQYLYGASVIHYTGESFGKGFFLRADAGLSSIEQEFENTAEKKNNGLGILGGGGWSIDLDGTRFLLIVNYAYRQAGGQVYHTLGISAGGLF